MKNVRYLFTLLLLLTTTAFAQTVIKTSSGNAVVTASGKSVLTSTPLTSYVGPATTATAIPNKLNTTAGFTIVTRKAHYMRSATTRLKFAYPCWYVNAIGNGQFSQELGVGNNCTVNAWIEYPVGTYTNITFSGSNSVSITDGTTLYSDFITESIPNGALWYELVSMTATTGNNFPYTTPASIKGTPLAWTMGELSSLNSSPPALPANNFSSGSTTGSSAYYAASILGDTTSPTFCLIGDSRTEGNLDVADRAYEVGDLARSVGPSYGYLNLGVSGERAWGFFYSSTKRMAIINTSNCTNIVDELGVNDYGEPGGTLTTPAQWKATKQLISGRFNGKKYARTTMEPVTTSSDNFATIGGQTGATYNANITTSNDWVRSPGDGVPYVDLSTAVSSSLDSGLWQANGIPHTYASDGTHATALGDLLIQSSGVLNPSTLAASPAVSTTYPSLTFTGIVSPSYVTGQFGNAISLPTGTQGIALGYAPGTAFGQVECWIKNPTAALQPLCQAGYLQIYSTPSTCFAGMHVANTFTGGNTTLCDGAWHDVAITSSNNGTTITWNLYVDCVLEATKTSTSIGAGGWLNNIGATIGAASGLAAQVDELSVWNTNPYDTSCVLPTSPYVGNEAGLIGVWHLDGSLAGVQGPAGF